MKITKLIYGSGVSRFFSILISIIALTSCGGESEKSSAWESFKPLNEIDKHIQGYYDASLGSGANPKSGNPGVYVDFSDGLVQAYSGNSLNLQIIQAITNKLVSPNVEWFKLGSSTIVKLDYSSNQLYNKVTDPKQYKDIMAPIKLSLEKITSSHNDALLITDFEEYTSDGKEQFENYPKEYFTKWLNAGNSITFFYTDYSETNKKSKITTNKHLYFTVFTHGQANENSMVTQIKDSFKGRIVTKTFELNNNLYKVSNNYGGKENTGISNKNFSKWVNYNFNGFSDKNLPFEVIGFNKPLNEDLDKYIQNIIDKEDGLFINKLTLNALDQSSFKLSQIGVKVYDVSDDYERFAQSSEAKKHIPVLTKDAEKNQVWDKNSKNDPIIVECYKPKTNSLKEEWIYKPTDLTPKLMEEFLDVNKTIVAAHLKNDPGNIELNTVLHSNFKLKKISNSSALIRVDYIIEDASFNDSNPQLDDFKWLSGTLKGKQQESLKEAIRNTLQDPSINPKGKVVYTYFIKFANKSETEK
jgi:hypothetical protein